MNIEQPDIINQYNIICSWGGADHMDQNISMYIWLTSTQRNGGGHFFDLLLMWPSIMLTKYRVQQLIKKYFFAYVLKNLGVHQVQGKNYKKFENLKHYKSTSAKDEKPFWF